MVKNQTTKQTSEVTIKVQVDTVLWNRYLELCKQTGQKDPGGYFSYAVHDEIRNVLADPKLMREEKD